MHRINLFISHAEGNTHRGMGMHDGIDIRSCLEDLSIYCGLPRDPSCSKEFLTRAVKVNNPIIFVPVIGSPKQLYCDSIIFRKTDAYMSPYISDFPFEDSRPYSQVLLKHLNLTHKDPPCIENSSSGRGNWGDNTLTSASKASASDYWTCSRK